MRENMPRGDLRDFGSSLCKQLMYIVSVPVLYGNNSQRAQDFLSYLERRPETALAKSGSRAGNTLAVAGYAFVCYKLIKANS